MSVLDERQIPLDIGSLHQNISLHPLYTKNVTALSEPCKQEQLLYAPSVGPTSNPGPPSTIEMQTDAPQPSNNFSLETDARQNCSVYSERHPACVSDQLTDYPANLFRSEVLNSYSGAPQVISNGKYYEPIYSNNRGIVGLQDFSKFFVPNNVSGGCMTSAFMDQSPPTDQSSLLQQRFPPRPGHPGVCTTIDTIGYTTNSVHNNPRYNCLDRCNPSEGHLHANYQNFVNNEQTNPTQSQGVDLLVSNLDYNIGPKEWRKILLTQLQSVVKNVQSVVIQSQSDGSNCAIIRVKSIDEARLAISQFHRKKIGYKRIQMNILTPNISTNVKNLRADVITILKSVAGHALPLCKFIDLFEKRFYRPIALSDLYKLRDVVEIKEQAGAQGGRLVVLNCKAGRSDLLETNNTKEPLVCQRHCPEGSQGYLRIMEGTILPSVKIPLSVFRKNVMTVLYEHGGSLPLLSFPVCYEALLGELPTGKMSTASSTISATEISTDFERSTQAEDAADQGAVRNNGDEKISPFLGEGTEYSSSVPLEHLLNCVPNVAISTEANGLGKIVLHCDQSAEPNTSLAPTQFSPDLSVTKVQQSDLTTLLLPPGSSTSTGPSGVLQDQLHQFSREVVDLLKHQPHCQIALSKFIPTYHHHFGKQCRVADYGYSKLHELISALPNVVHVLGSGNTRILTLSHRVQVRRFTNEVIKILKSQSTKSCKVTDYPNLYKRIYRKDFHIADYGVCYLMDMLMEISDNTIEISQSGSDCVISLPKRVQTAEEKERTELFGIEVADLLRQSPRCRLQFNKFIPSYHHHFSRQCRVADYGFTKLIDLLEAVPNVVRIIEDHGEKYVVLARSRHLRIVGEQLLSMLESASNKRIGLEDLSGAYLKAQGYHLCPEDFGFNSLRELLASLPRIVRIEKVPVAVSETTPNDSSGIRGSGEAVDPKLMSEVMDNEDRIVTEKTETSVQEYVCLADRAQVKHLCHKTLLILLETPNGMLPTAAFTEQFRCTFKTEPDLLLIRNELDDVVEFRNSPNPMKENSTASSTISSNTTVLPEEQSVIKEQTGCLNESVIGDGSAEPSDRTDPTTFGKYICLQPLILFARELRDLLRQNQGKILLVQLCAAYQRRFGVPLSPQRYNHLSLATLIQSVDFVAVTRGRGVRCTLVVCQDFLGKLSHRVAYNTKPVLGSETVDSKSGKSCETMNSTVNENTTEKIPIPVRVEPQPKASWASTHASSSSVPGVTPLLSRAYPTSDFGDKATTMSLPYNYYSVPVSTHPPISMVSSNSDYTNVIAPSYSYYDYASQTIRQSDGSFGPILYPSPPQTTGYGPLTVITNTTAHQPMSHDFLRNGEQSTTGSIQYSRPMYPSPYSMPFTLNYTTGYSPIGSQIPGAPPIISTSGAQQLTTTSNPTFPCNVNSFGAWSPASSSTPLYLNRCTSKGQQQLDEFVEKLAYGGMQYDMGLISGPETSHLMTQQQSTSNRQEQPSDISTNTENDRRAIYCSSNEPRVHDGTQIPLAGLPPHPTQQGTGVACFPNRLSAEKLPNFSCNAETFAQLVNRRVTSDISKMELNGGEMVTKPPGLVASHVLPMPSYFQHESLGDLTSTSHFLTNKPVESITNLRDSSLSLSSALTQMYPPNTLNMPPNAEHHSSCAKDPNGRQLSSVTNEEAGTSQQSGNTEQQPQFYPSERNLFTSAGEDRCERSASKSDGRYDQGRSFSAEESSTGFCLDGLLAELRLEENQQKQQMRQQEMQHQQEQQRSHWSTMLSATNLEHALPMVPNQFAYF